MKKLTNYLIIYFGVMFLQSCSSIEASQPQSDTEGQTQIGHYIYGHEANSFQPCGQKTVFWVVGSNEILGLMAKKYSNHIVNPYDEVFVKITGDFINKASDGFAADYDGQIQVMKMFFMKKKSITDCK